MIYTVQILKATHQTDIQKLHESLSNTIETMRHSMIKLQQLENQHNIINIDPLMLIVDRQLSQTRPLQQTATSTPDKKVQSLTEKRDHVTSWHNELISTDKPDQEDSIASVKT